MCSQIDQTMYEHVYEAVGEEQEMKTETERERESECEKTFDDTE